MKCPKISFNTFANVLASVSAIGLAGIVSAGTYVYINKDAIIDSVKQQALEAVTGGLGGLGGGLPTGSNDLPSLGATPGVGGPAAPQAPSLQTSL